MTDWSQKLIKETLDTWQPKYAQKGVELTEEDARDILNNVTNLFDYLNELDKKYSAEITND